MILKLDKEWINTDAITHAVDNGEHGVVVFFHSSSKQDGYRTFWHPEADTLRQWLDTLSVDLLAQEPEEDDGGADVIIEMINLSRQALEYLDQRGPFDRGEKDFNTGQARDLIERAVETGREALKR
jgi:hypothetical protein